MSKFLSDRRVIDPVLTNLAKGFVQSDFIAEQVMPVVTTDKEGLRIPIWGKGSFVEIDTTREVNADSNVVTTDKADFMNVVLVEHDLAAGVDYRTEHESMFAEKKKALRKVTHIIKLRQELETAKLLTNKASYNAKLTEKLTGKKAWSDPDSNPVEAIFEAKEKVRETCGIEPNVLVLDKKVYNIFKFHPILQKYIGGNKFANLSKQDLITIFELDDILIGGSHFTTKDTSGNLSDFKPVWDNFASLIVRTKQLFEPDETNPSFGYTFRRKGAPFADFYASLNKKIEYQRYTDIRTVATVGGDAGYLFETPIAAKVAK